MSKLEYLPSDITVQVFRHSDPSDETRMMAALRMGECRPPLEASADTIAGLAFGPIDHLPNTKRDEAPDGFVSDVSFAWTIAQKDKLSDASPIYDYGHAATKYASPLRLQEQLMLQQLIVEATNGVRRGLSKLAGAVDLEEAEFYHGIQGRALNELAFFVTAPRLIAAQKYKTTLVPVLKLLESHGLGLLDDADCNVSGPMQITAREFMASTEWRSPTIDFFSLSENSTKKIARLVVAETACLAREAVEIKDETWLIRPGGEDLDLRPSLIYAPSSVVQGLLHNTQIPLRPALWEAYRQGAYPFDPASMIHRYRAGDRRKMWRPPLVGHAIRTVRRSLT